MRDFLELSYDRLRNSENLRRDVKVATKKIGMKSRDDMLLVQEESATNIHNVIIGLEMLRLMCEGHNDTMQNYLREQTQNGITRINNVNMLNVVTDMLIKYKEIIDDFNIDLGNAIFEFFIEISQGPCYPNQVEICKTKLLETVEDMLIELVLGSDKIGLMQEDDKTVSEYKKSELMRHIINFMSAVLEDTNDTFITSKVSIHINQDMLLTRLNLIYKLFEQDIKKFEFSFGLGQVMNVVNKMTNKKKKSSKNLGSDKKKKGFTISHAT
jgi:RyR and IP3R Homology associated